MLTIVGDTHGRRGHRLGGAVLSAVREADAVVHTGDFLTQSVLDAFEDESDRLHAVYGNNDSREVRERLSASRVFEAEGLRIVLVHGHEHGHTSLSLLGRQEDADLVVFGHSHSPQFVPDGEVALLNPGSYAVPRGFRPAYATLDATDSGARGRLVEPDGTVFETFAVERRAE